MSTKGKRSRDVEREVSREKFVTSLRRLADALEENKVFVLQVRGERIRIPKDAFLSIEHEREDGVDEVEFQLRFSKK